MLRYIVPIILVLGNIAYLFTAALFSIIGSYCALIPFIYAAYYPDPFGRFLILCRLRLYIGYICAMTFRSMIVLATIDRYALTSSRSTFRTFASISTARRAIITTFLFWSAAGFHLLIGPRIENNRCLLYGLYGFLFSVFQLLSFGILPSVLMIVFALLLIKNIRQSRTRSGSHYTKSFLRKRDRNLIELKIKYYSALKYLRHHDHY
ncbi:unnamed protein product [Adineta ricciae]|uniref:G-protein coupled receptors family 1 profile domain-containing protein n=1 Tax=Adineta ricciae TaxID=249248 RepID=A0A815MXU2_ADIRI|nr:unnamed protein product [Adineta ricciae]